MADLKMEVSYRLSLTRDEWQVVSKALRLMGSYESTQYTTEERTLAVKLQEWMVLQKASVLDQMAGEADIHADNVREAKRRGASKP